METPNDSGHENAAAAKGSQRLQLSRLRQRLLALVIAGVGSAAASIISYASAIYAGKPRADPTIGHRRRT